MNQYPLDICSNSRASIISDDAFVFVADKYFRDNNINFGELLKR